MKESVKFKKEIARVSKEIVKRKNNIINGNWKDPYSDIVKNLYALIFDEGLDEYSLSEEEDNIYYWIKACHNTSMITHHFRGNSKDSDKDMLVRLSAEECNRNNLMSLVFNFDQFLEKTKVYSKVF